MGLKEVRCIYKVHVYTFLLVKTNLYTFLYKKVISGIWTFFWSFFFGLFFFDSRNSRYLILDLSSQVIITCNNDLTVKIM